MAGAQFIFMNVRYLEEQAARFAHMRDGVVGEVKAWAYAEGLEALAFSQLIVPVDTGALKGSGFVELPKVRGGEILVTVGYGGPAAPYAWDVHENLDMKHDAGEEPKFLEQGLMSREGPMLDTLSTALDALYR